MAKNRASVKTGFEGRASTPVAMVTKLWEF